MTVQVVVVRPQPGADATAQRLAAAGLRPLVAPLYEARAIDWTAPDPAQYDALLLTSALALRHGGPALHAYRGLPAWCVGAATAAAATAAGLTVARVGHTDAATLIADPAASDARWLWLAGRRHQPLAAPGGGTLTIVPVYDSAPLPPSAALVHAFEHPAILMAHSAAAAGRLGQIVPDRALHHLLAISVAAAATAGPGWRGVHAPARPLDAEMVAIAALLCQNACHG